MSWITQIFHYVSIENCFLIRKKRIEIRLYLGKTQIKFVFSLA